MPRARSRWTTAPRSTVRPAAWSISRWPFPRTSWPEDTSMSFTRRQLITRGALLVTSGWLAPSFITRTALALDRNQAAGFGGLSLDPGKQSRILVVLQLSGGNDGINTLIP